MKLLKVTFNQALCFQRLILRKIIANSGLFDWIMLFKIKYQSSYRRLPGCT